MPAWSVQQRVLIEAPVSKVYQTVADYGTWTTWSPWLIADPAAKVEMSSAANGVGAKYHWTGTYEIYTTTPPSTPEMELQTDIYLPLRG